MQTIGVPAARGNEEAGERNAGRAGPDLRWFELLSGLNEPRMRAVAGGARVLELKRPNRIYRRGDPSDHVFLVKTGVVKIATIDRNGRELVLGLLQRGALFGESALVDETPRDHSAQAFEDVVVYALHRELLLRLIRDSTDLGYQVARLMALRIRGLRARVEPLLCRRARARVAHTLLALAAEHSVADADGVLIPLRLSQAELARLAGLSRETVNVVLRALRDGGLVEADRHSIRLKDPDALRSV